MEYHPASRWFFLGDGAGQKLGLRLAPADYPPRRNSREPHHPQLDHRGVLDPADHTERFVPDMSAQVQQQPFRLIAGLHEVVLWTSQQHQTRQTPDSVLSCG